MKKPLLIGMFGYPGSGKTYFSERLAKRENFFHLASDRVRLAMFKTPTYTQDEHNVVFRFMDYLAEEFLKKGVSVIYDANFNKRIYRAGLQKLAKRCAAEYHFVWIKTDEEKAIKRLEQRAKLVHSKRKELYRPIGIEIFREFQAQMELPKKSEKVIEIDGHADFAEQFEAFCDAVK